MQEFRNFFRYLFKLLTHFNSLAGIAQTIFFVVGILGGFILVGKEAGFIIVICFILYASYRVYRDNLPASNTEDVNILINQAYVSNFRLIDNSGNVMKEGTCEMRFGFSLQNVSQVDHQIIIKFADISKLPFTLDMIEDRWRITIDNSRTSFPYRLPHTRLSEVNFLADSIPLKLLPLDEGIRELIKIQNLHIILKITVSQTTIKEVPIEFIGFGNQFKNALINQIKDKAVNQQGLTRETIDLLTDL